MASLPAQKMTLVNQRERESLSFSNREINEPRLFWQLIERCYGRAKLVKERRGFAICDFQRKEDIESTCCARLIESAFATLVGLAS